MGAADSMRQEHFDGEHEGTSLVLTLRKYINGATAVINDLLADDETHPYTLPVQMLSLLQLAIGLEEFVLVYRANSLARVRYLDSEQLSLSVIGSLYRNDTIESELGRVLRKVDQ